MRLKKQTHTNPKPRKKVKKNNTTDKIIPIKYYNDELQCFVKNNQALIDLVKVRCKDLNSTNDQDIQMDILVLTKFLRTYPNDCKMISINIPVDCTKQIAYYRRKIANERNPLKLSQLRKKMAQLEWLEKNRLKKEFYFMFFFDDPQNYYDEIRKIRSLLSENNMVDPIENKDEVFIKLLNKNIQSLYNRYIPSDEDKEKAIRKYGYDPYLLSAIQPQGGINFGAVDHVRTGTGYEACLHIYDYPSDLSPHWLNQITNLPGIVVLDISNTDTIEIRNNLRKSIREQKGRLAVSREATESQQASDRYQELLALNRELASYKEILKLIDIRIFLSAKTKDQLDLLISDTQRRLVEFKSAVYLNEQKSEWSSIFLSYQEQQKLDDHRMGQPLTSESIAAGDPFHFSYLDDPFGSYYGSTPCGGTFNFYPFTNTDRRKHYNGIVFGTMGSGKSTLLKKMAADCFYRGDFVRIFDPSGEWIYMAKQSGWKVINMDGSDGHINIFQILQTDENTGVAYQRHITKLSTIYQILDPAADQIHIATFEGLIRNLYIVHGILPENGDIPTNSNITQLPAAAYPTLTDFVNYLENYLKNMDVSQNPTETQLNIRTAKVIDDIRVIFQRLRANYGMLLDCHTDIDNIMDQPSVVFIIKSILQLSFEIKNVVLYNLATLCWDNCVKNGLIMKNLYETNQIRVEDIQHFLIEIDEFHHLADAKNIVVLRELTIMQREMRKYFAGLVLATQNFDDVVPEGSSEQGLALIKTLFNLSIYKFVGKQDANLIPAMRKSFGKTLTESEIDRIPKLQMGQFILSIAGDQSFEVKIFADDDELEMYRGGM